MKLSLKQYRVLKIAVVILLAAFVGMAVSSGVTFLIPLGAAIAASFGLLLLRKKVDGVIADERDYETGGTAARWAITAFSWMGIVLMLVLFSQRAGNPLYEPVATTLAYSICALMILYSVFFRFHDRIAHMNKKAVSIALGILLLLIIFVIGIRLLSGEDAWICSNGEWVAHGHPSYEQPARPCESGI